MQATPTKHNRVLIERQPLSRRAASSQDRPFACPIPTCTGRFHRKFTLHEHMKTHTGEKPHECPVAGCGKRFSTSGNLGRHYKLHAVDKLCCPMPHCSRQFTSRQKLFRHLKVHVANTPQTCDIRGCGKTFSTSGNLTRHRRTRHVDRMAKDSRRSQTLFFSKEPPPHQQLFKFGLPSRIMHYPAVSGAMLVKGPIWSAAPAFDAVTAGLEPPRISDKDVQDLLDFLFVENPATAPDKYTDNIIRCEPFFCGDFH